MAGSVGDGAAAVGLTSLSVVDGLSTEGSLVDLALAGTRERHSVGLELTHGDGSLSSHVLDSVLVTEPVGSLDSVVEMVSPVVLVHVAESSVDSTLEKKQ